MAKMLAILGIVLALAGCATHSEPKPAVCDGKHRRPANAYGSVLPTASDAKTATPGTPGPRSSLDPKSTRPCGARA